MAGVIHFDIFSSIIEIPIAIDVHPDAAAIIRHHPKGIDARGWDDHVARGMHDVVLMQISADLDTADERIIRGIVARTAIAIQIHHLANPRIRREHIVACNQRVHGGEVWNLSGARDFIHRDPRCQQAETESL